MKNCGNCNYYEPFFGACGNEDSENRADFMDRDDCCEEWEIKKMNGNEYQKLAMRTNDGGCKKRLSYHVNHNNMSTDIGEVFNASLGLSGEVGELNDMIKKFVFHKTPMDEGHFKKEIGDILWYVALMCHACGYDLDDIMQMNIDKLKARYPEGFDTERANNRSEGDV